MTRRGLTCLAGEKFASLGTLWMYFATGDLSVQLSNAA